MRVKALARGIYGRMYEAGDEFEIATDAHLGSWMLPVSPADCKRLADLMKSQRSRELYQSKSNHGVPITTGPGLENSLGVAALLPKTVADKVADKAPEKPKA